MNWDNSIENFKNYLKLERGLSTNSIKSYEYDLIQFKKYINDNKINIHPYECTSEIVKIYIYNSFSDNKSSSSQARCISSLKSFFNYLLFEGKIKISPIDDIETPKLEKKLPERKPIDVDQISKPQAFMIGLAQCFSLIPGVSRAASTIMGGLIVGLDRKTAAEFSFFLAIPIIVAASFFDLFKNIDLLNSSDIPVFAIGFITSFISALIVIKIFISFISRHNFVIFGWYRILVGLITLYYFY